jgi:SET domain
MSRARVIRMEKAVGAALTNTNIQIRERATPTGSLRGIYATRPFIKGEWICSYHGKIISREELAKTHEKDRSLFERITEYGVQPCSVPGAHLYPHNLDEVGAHLINHSCGPNADWGRMEHGAMLVQATRPIAEGEEITIHYRWIGAKAAIEENWHPCSCLAPYCCGTIELKLEYQVLQGNRLGVHVGGHSLSPKEISKRFLADIMNDSTENESTVLNYPKNLGGMSMNMDGSKTQIEMQFNMAAFAEKLQIGAALTARELMTTILPEIRKEKRPVRPSLRRIEEIASRYVQR